MSKDFPLFQCGLLNGNGWGRKHYVVTERLTLMGRHREARCICHGGMGVIYWRRLWVDGEPNSLSMDRFRFPWKKRATISQKMVYFVMLTALTRERVRLAASLSRRARRSGLDWSHALRELEKVDRCDYACDISSFNEYLNVLGRCHGPIEAMAYFEELFASNGKREGDKGNEYKASIFDAKPEPNIITFNILLTCLAHMEKQRVVSWQAFLDANERLAVAEELVNKIMKKGLTPDTYTLAAVTSICRGAETPKLALSLVAYMSQLARRQPEVRLLDAIAYTSVIDCLSRSIPSSTNVFYGEDVFRKDRETMAHPLEIIDQLSREMDELGIPKNVRTYTAMIDVCRRLGTCAAEEIGFKLFEGMLRAGIAPDDVIIGLLLTCAARVGDATRALELYRFQKQRVIRSDRAMTSLIEACVKAGEFECAWQFFNVMRGSGTASLGRDHGTQTRYFARANVITYSVMLLGLARAGQLDHLKLLLDEAALLTSVDQVSAVSRLSSRDESRKRVRSRPWESQGMGTMIILIDLCATHDNYDLIHFIHSRRGQAGYPMYTTAVMNALIDGFGRCNALSMAEQVFDEMIDSHLPRDIASYNALLNAYAISKRYQPNVWVRMMEDTSAPTRIEPDWTTCLATIGSAQSIENLEDVMAKIEATKLHGQRLLMTSATNAVLQQGGIRRSDPLSGHRRFQRAVTQKIICCLDMSSYASSETRKMIPRESSLTASLTNWRRAANLLGRLVLIGADVTVEAHAFTQFVARLLRSTRASHGSGPSYLEIARDYDAVVDEVWLRAPRVTACFTARIYATLMLSGWLNKAMALFREMEGVYGLTPDAITYSALASGILRLFHMRIKSNTMSFWCDTDYDVVQLLIARIEQCLPTVKQISRRKLERKLDRLVQMTMMMTRSNSVHHD